MGERVSKKPINEKAISTGGGDGRRLQQVRLWRLENAEAIAEMNAYVEKNGLPLGQYRQF